MRGFNFFCFAPDAFGMNLAYYLNDFNRTGSAYNNITHPTALKPDANRDLFNGNISTWTSQTVDTDTLQYEQQTGQQYWYDELNRIVRNDFRYYAGGWNNSQDYMSTYKYDGNGLEFDGFGYRDDGVVINFRF